MSDDSTLSDSSSDSGETLLVATIPLVKLDLSFSNKAENIYITELVPLSTGEEQEWGITLNRRWDADYHSFSFYVKPSSGKQNRQLSYKYKINYQNCQCNLEILDGSRKVLRSMEALPGEFGIHGFHLRCAIRDLLVPTSKNLIVSMVLNGEPDLKKDVKEEPFYPMKNMLDEEILCDVIIRTKGKEFKCHKFMLAVKSEYFRAMFQTEMVESQENSVNWVNVFDSDTVSDMLHYIYTDTVPPKIDKTLFSLTEAAASCLLNGLKDICVEKLMKEITLRNVVLVLNLADKLDLNSVMEAAINCVLENYEEVTASESFKEVSQDIKARLLPKFINVVGDKYVAKKRRLV